jgi:hypothetical protein
MWRIWWANNASKWQMGFNSAFKGFCYVQHLILSPNMHYMNDKLVYYCLLMTDIPNPADLSCIHINL